jgi:hypothetical protein
MSRIRPRRLFWDAPAATDVTGYEIYAGDPANAEFLAEVDAGGHDPHASTTATEYIIANLPEGTYQFAVAALDDAGNYSDPYQHPAWASVPLDVTPPDAPSGGGLD